MLTGAIPLESGLKATPVANLSVLTAGIPPENPAELLSNSNLQGLVQELRGRYDFVLFDCAADPRGERSVHHRPRRRTRCSSWSGEKNNRTVLRPALADQLDAHGIRLLGVIANDAAASSQAEGSYGNYEECYLDRSRHTVHGRRPAPRRLRASCGSSTSSRNARSGSASDPLFLLPSRSIAVPGRRI